MSEPDKETDLHDTLDRVHVRILHLRSSHDRLYAALRGILSHVVSMSPDGAMALNRAYSAIALADNPPEPGPDPVAWNAAITEAYAAAMQVIYDEQDRERAGRALLGLKKPT